MTRSEEMYGFRQYVSGAALYSRVEKQLREELEQYGLPMQEYTCKIVPYYENMPSLLLFATFTRISNGAEIEVENIYTDGQGNLTQYGRPKLG